MEKNQRQRITVDAKNMMKILLCVAILIIFWLLPASAPLTPVGMKVLGVFVATVVALSIVDTTWPAILCIPLFALTGVMSLNDAIIGSLGSWITMFVIMSFVLTYALNKTGFTTRLTAWYMSKKFVNKSPWVFTFMLILLGALVGLFLDPVPTVAFFMTFSNKIFKEIGYTTKDRYPHMVTMALAFAINIAGAMTPISHPLALLGMGIYKKASGNDISLFQYMAYAVPIGIAMLLLMFLVLKLFFKVDLEKFEHFDVKKVLDEVKPMQIREKIVVGVFFLVVFFWVLPGIVKLFSPTLPPFINSLNKLGPAFPPIVAVPILAILKVDDKPVVDLKDAFSNGMSWGVIFLVAAAILLGGAVTAPGVGFSEWITKNIVPMISGLPEMMLVLVIAFVTTLLTNFTSNVTTITLMTGLAVSLALGGGVLNPAAIALTTTFTGACAYMVPASFASIGVLYGNEYSHGGTTFKYGGIMVIVTTIVATFIGYPIAKMLLG